LENALIGSARIVRNSAIALDGVLDPTLLLACRSAATTGSTPDSHTFAARLVVANANVIKIMGKANLGLIGDPPFSLQHCNAHIDHLASIKPGEEMMVRGDIGINFSKGSNPPAVFYRHERQLTPDRVRARLDPSVAEDWYLVRRRTR
jgi:hypothetical protein